MVVFVVSLCSAFHASISCLLLAISFLPRFASDACVAIKLQACFIDKT